MAEVALFSVQIAAQTRDIFAMWKIVQNVPISNINLYHKTHFRVFHILFSFRTFVII